jgi:uncharacterized protein (DUF302 family)
MKLSRGDGLIDSPSNHSVDENVEKLKRILQAKGVTLFALVDHSGEAAKVEMSSSVCAARLAAATGLLELT